jgi:flagellar biosynthesis protein FliQ
VVDWLMGQLTNWIADALSGCLDLLLSMMGGTALLLPNVTTVAAAHQAWAQVLGIVNVCYVLAIVAGAAIAMSYETVQIRYAAKDLAPRLVFGLVAANLSWDWCNRILVLGQQLLDALADGALGGANVGAAVHDQVDAALHDSPPAAALLMLIIAALIVFLLASLLFGWIVRIGVLLVLVVSAPLALACHGLPQIDSVAKLWWRSLFGTVGIQLVQALTLLTGIAVFVTPTSPVAAQMHVSGGPTLNLFVLLALLWSAVKIPSMMRRYVLKGGGSNNIGSYAVRALLVRQLTRGVR